MVSCNSIKKNVSPTNFSVMPLKCNQVWEFNDMIYYGKFMLLRFDIFL